MALSRELTRRLDLDEEPLSKRLRLAENTFASEELPVTRREDLVLRWLCREAGKRDVPSENADVRRTLSRCLRRRNRFGGSALDSELRRMLIDAAATGTSSLGDDVDFLAVVLLSPEMRRYFRSDHTRLCLCVARLLEHQEAAEDSRFPELVTSSLRCLTDCRERCQDRGTFVRTFVTLLSRPLCRLARDSGDGRPGPEIRECLGRLLFGKSRNFRPEESDAADDSASIVFAALREESRVWDEEATVLVFSEIFRAAVVSCKNYPTRLDSIFRNLVESAARARLRVLGSVARGLAEATMDYEHAIDGTSLFDHLRGFVDEVLSSERIDSTGYEALGALASLNPLVVGDRLPSILRRVLLETRLNDDEANAYADLAVVLIGTTLRLRSEKKLFSWILSAIEELLVARMPGKGELPSSIITVLPDNFTKELSKCVSGMTTAQTTAIFATLIFHFDRCLQLFSSSDRNVAGFLLRATVRLSSAYFEGVRIFDHSVPRSGQEKFFRAVKDLGRILSSLGDQMSETLTDDETTDALLSAVLHWDEVRAWMTYHAPDVSSETLPFPIDEDRMRIIAARIQDARFKYNANRIFIRHVERDLRDDERADLSSLPDGLENAWSILLDRHPRILSSMNDSEIRETADRLLEDATSSRRDNAVSMRRLTSERVQNDERFVETLARRMAEKIEEGTTSKNDTLTLMADYLKILSRLPLEHLSLETRTLLVRVVYRVRNECDSNEEIARLCADVTLDASERCDVDVTAWIGIDSLMERLSQDESLRRVVESSLRNAASPETMKTLTRKSLARRDDDSALMLLECLERVGRRARNDEEKRIFRKAGKKLCKKLMDGKSDEAGNPKLLAVALKVFTSNGKVPDDLAALVESTLAGIFAEESATSRHEDQSLVTEGLNLFRVFLKRGGTLNLAKDGLVDGVWPSILEDPSREIVEPLLERSEPRVLAKMLATLRAKTILALEESSPGCLTRIALVWDCVARIRMSGPRQKIRAAALHDMLRTLQISKITPEAWPTVLRVTRSALTESWRLADKGIIDVAMLLAGRSLREAGSSVCEDVLAVCRTLVKPATITTDALPSLLGLYRTIVNLVVRESRKNVEDEDTSSRRSRLGRLALDLEKFTNVLTKSKKDLARISPYAIADLVRVFSEGVIPSRVKGPLENSVGYFLSVCDPRAVSLLSRTLPSGMRAIFKTLCENYDKFYKFTGNV